MLLGALVDSVATLPAVTSGTGDSLGYLSFALLTTARKTRAFEIILGEPNAAALAGCILSAVARDSTAFRDMTACAYRMGIRSEDDSKDVSAQVAFRVEPFRRIGRSGLYETRVRDDGRHRLQLDPRLFAGWGVR